MNELISLYLIDFALICFITILGGDDLSIKDKIFIIIGFSMFVLIIGFVAFLIVGGN